MCELDDVFIFSTWRETTYNITQFIPQLHEIKKTQLIGFISPTIKKTQLIRFISPTLFCYNKKDTIKRTLFHQQ